MMVSRMMMGRGGRRNAPNSATSRQSHARSTHSNVSVETTHRSDRERQEGDNYIVARISTLFPTFLMLSGILLFITGIPVLICGYVHTLNYPSGQRHGPALIVFGFIFALVGFIWMKVRQNRARKLLKESRENQVRDSRVSDSRRSSAAANSSASVSRPPSHASLVAAKTEDVKPKLDKNATENPPDVGTGLPNDGYEVDLSDVDEKQDIEKKY